MLICFLLKSEKKEHKWLNIELKWEQFLNVSCNFICQIIFFYIILSRLIRTESIFYFTNKFYILLKDKNIELNRKSLAHMAVNDPDGFSSIIDSVTK